MKSFKMRNVIILGSGRSGTSMVAGCLASSGYFMGKELLTANNSNPKGFFEDIEVNSINEEILASVAPKRPKILGDIFFRHVPLPYQRWLLALPPEKKPFVTSATKSRIRAIVKNEPFCLKDPRFSYTLPCWIPFLDNIVFIVVFREPMATVKSIIKECKYDPRLHSLTMNVRRALKLWDCMYRNALKLANNSDNWLFIHYDQVFSHEGIKLIEQHTGAKVDFSFPEKKFKRSMAMEPAPHFVQKVYLELCKRAEFQPLHCA